MKVDDGGRIIGVPGKVSARRTRFPMGIKKLRERHPSGVLVRASFTVDGGEVSYQGRLGEEFFQLARAFLQASKAN